MIRTLYGYEKAVLRAAVLMFLIVVLAVVGLGIVLGAIAKQMPSIIPRPAANLTSKPSAGIPYAEPLYRRVPPPAPVTIAPIVAPIVIRVDARLFLI